MDVIVKMDHLRQLHYCARGVRAFYARYKLDYAAFLQHGTPSSVLLNAAGEDAMVIAAVEVAREQQQ